MKVDLYSTTAIAKQITDSIDSGSARSKRLMRRKSNPKRRVIKAKKVTRRMAMAIRLASSDSIRLMKIHKRAKQDGLKADEVIKQVTKERMFEVGRRINGLVQSYREAFRNLEGMNVLKTYEKLGRIEKGLRDVESEFSH